MRPPSLLAGRSAVDQAKARILREDKNVVIQPLVEVVTDPYGELETPSQIEEHIRTYHGLVDQWNETIKGGRWSSERTEWKARRDECLRTLTEFEASLAQPRKTVYQLHSKRHVVQFSEEDYTKHLMTQATSPVWVSTWDGKRWRWYLDRFWWDSEDRTW